MPAPRLLAALTGRRVTSALGLVLAVYALFHVAELSSSVAGREAFVSRSGALIAPWLRGLIFVPIVLHASLALRPVDGKGRHRDEGVRRLQHLAGFVLAVFLVVHLGQVYLPALLEGQAAVYDELSHLLSLPVFAGIYVFGVAATALHLAQGVEAASTTLSPERARVARVLALVLGFVVFGAGVNVVSHFASGRALVAF